MTEFQVPDIPTLSPEALTDMRLRVLRKETPTLDELRAAVHTLRENRFAAAASKTTKAKKSAAKKAPLDQAAIADIFGDANADVE